MAPLETFPSPLLPTGPPEGYGWEERDVSNLSTTVSFISGLNQRDRFLGQRRCVVCGRPNVEHCHIIPASEQPTWEDLQKMDKPWVPRQAKGNPKHEPRNGLLLCPNHHKAFDNHQCIIRYIPRSRKFVYINISGVEDDQPYHGKAIGLDIRDKFAPFPTLFIIQEKRARGRWPFASVGGDIPDDPPWQDWITSSRVLRNTGEDGFFHRDEVREDQEDAEEEVEEIPQLLANLMAGLAFPLSVEGVEMALLNVVVNEIVAETHRSASWRACVQEGTNWDWQMVREFESVGPCPYLI